MIWVVHGLHIASVDIKELKLLGDFDHPNIVRFVSVFLMSAMCARLTQGSFFQLGVSIPVNTKDTPVMIVSELCANGDLFDYIRNVEAPTLYRVVSIGTI